MISTFVGRRHELERLAALLESARLVTLTGAAGTGKTRLAAAAATGEVRWVELASLTDETLVGDHAAATLGVRQQSATPIIEAIVAAIGEQPLLLVFDNCEHVLDGAATLIEVLLGHCPHLRILATSRQPLGIAGEHVLIVPPLALPGAAETDPRAAASAEAVQLFVERAGEVVPGFALTEANAAAIVRICRSVDGLPLAIELAAARVRMLTPEQLVRRLDDVFGVLTSGSRTAQPRHRTLRALLDWSYDLLDPRERRLFRRLSVFAGGFTLAAAESITPLDDMNPAEMLDVLASLVDRSLVTMRERDGEARYTLLQVVRRYAANRAESDETPAARALLDRRYARFYTDLAVQAAAVLHGPGQSAALAQFSAEHDNFRAVLDAAVSAGNVDEGLELSVALAAFWMMRAQSSEARHWLGAVLGLGPPESAALARALTALGVFSRMQGDHDQARVHYVRAVDVARRAGDAAALADALVHQGQELGLHRDITAAEPVLDEAIAIRRGLGDRSALSRALSARASIGLAAGDTALARRLRTEAAGEARAANDRDGEARALIGLGEVARLMDRMDEARRCNEQAIELFRASGDTWHIASARQNLAWIAFAQGDIERGIAELADSTRIFFANGNHRIGAALCLAGLAHVMHARGEHAEAAAALGAAQRAFAEVGIKPAAADQRNWDAVRASLETALGDGFARAWAQDLNDDLMQTVTDLLVRFGGSTAPPSSQQAPTLSPEQGPARAESAMPVQASPIPALRVLALGPLEVHSDGRPVPADAWGAAKPRELLVHLLEHPHGRTREQVGLAFWPEATPAQISNGFHVTLYRLRKALGGTARVVLDGDRYRIAPDVQVEYDVTLFEQRATAALAAARAGSRDAGPLEEALVLYRGEFLEDEPVGEWSYTVRDRLRRLHTDLLAALGDAHREHGRFDAAADAYRRVIAVDDLHEPAYRGLMQALAASGHRSDALRLFERLSALLRDELDAEPETATVEAARALAIDA